MQRKLRDGAAAVKEISAVVERPPRRGSFKRRLGATLERSRNSPPKQTRDLRCAEEEGLVAGHSARNLESEGRPAGIEN